jgi:uncharacterized membrane protein YciS (DUF1049 family)
VRKALILLAIVAVLILVVGALNNGTAFDVDYAAGTVSAVSLFWVSAVIAALVFVVGLAAAWFALSSAAGSRRKLEAELQSTFERLREAEALAARRAPVVVETEPVAEPAAETAVAEPVTVVAAEQTVVEHEDETVVVGEDATVVVGPDIDGAEEEAEASASFEEDAGPTPAAETDDAPEPGEATAVTMTGAATPAEDAAQAGPVDGDAAANAPDDDASRSSGS